MCDIMCHMHNSVCVITANGKSETCGHNVCVRGKPALSGVLSSEPIEEFSTVTRGVTTPLSTGHTLTSTVRVYGSENPGVVCLCTLWLTYIVRMSVPVCECRCERHIRSMVLKSV